jgi:hypothetical protein
LQRYIEEIDGCSGSLVMKRLMLPLAVATVISAASVAPAGTGSIARQSASEATALVLVGPVEAVNAATSVAIVLGQKVLAPSASDLVVGDTVFVVGELNPDGSIFAEGIQDAGLYVPGATQVLLTGVVQKVDSAVGRVTVGGVSIDLTTIGTNQSLTLSKGSTVQIAGTQPVNGGLVLANGISGGALTQGSGISGGALTQGGGISGGALTQGSGISGGALTQGGGISGGALTQGGGISGGALTQGTGISGGALTQGSGISGGALTQGGGISGGAR